MQGVARLDAPCEVRSIKAFTFEKLLESLPESVQSRLNRDALQETIATKIRDLDPEPGAKSHDGGEESHEDEEPVAHDLNKALQKTDHTKPEQAQASNTATSFQVELAAALLLGVVVAVAALMFLHS